MRQCGDCTLCCKLLPVRSLGKKGGERCKHQRHTGCRVYSKLLRVAPECSLWNCRWLVNDDTGELSRPDRSHYVIDIMPDYVKTIDDETGEVTEVPVVQVWVDPKHPDAHRDPALRAWLERHSAIALIRFTPTDGFCLFPPSRMANREWMEKGSRNTGSEAHSVADIFRVLEATPQP